MSKLFTAICCLMLCTSAWGQSMYGALSGTVKDPSGAVIQGTAVTATNLATAAVAQGTTDANGAYRIVDLPPANYRVSFRHSGFSTSTVPSVTLLVSQSLELDAKLEVSTAAETITVTGSQTELDTSDATVGEVVPTASILELPLDVRDPFMLVGLTPGLQFGGNFGSDGETDVGRGFYRDDFNIGGGRSASQEILMDGAPNTTADGLNVIDPPLDSVLEFKVQQNSYDAQFGRTSGGVVNMVTKSGGNEFHGEAYEFQRHSIWDANSYFNKQSGVPLQNFARNQFGANLGGPIRRRMGFFFVDYEGLRQGYPVSQISTVPTTAERSGDFSGLFTSAGAPITIYDPTTSTYNAATNTWTRTAFPDNSIAGHIDPTAQKVVNMYPLPNRTPSNSFTNQSNYIYAAKQIYNDDKWDVRTDFNLNDKTKMFARFSRMEDLRENQGNMPAPIGGGRNVYDHYTQAVADVNRVITPDVLVDFDVSFGRALGVQYGRSFGFDLTQIGWPTGLVGQVSPQFPVFGESDLTGTSNGGDAIVNHQPRNDFATLGAVYVNKGSHSLKFGGDWRGIHFNEGQNSTPDGNFSFNRGFTQGPNAAQASAAAGFSLASFMLGYPASGSIIQLARVSTYGYYVAAWMQDDWRVSERLTLDLGLRWELDTGDYEKYNRLAYFQPNAASPLAGLANLPNLKGDLGWVGHGNPTHQQATDWTGVGPRLGVAYKVNNRTVVRGGAGIFYHPKTVEGTNAGTVEALRTTSYAGSIDGYDFGGASPISNPFPQGILPTANDRNPDANVGQTITAPVFDFVNGYSTIWSFGVQRELPGGFALDVHYWGNKGTHILQNYNLNQLPDPYLFLGGQLSTKVSNPFLGLVSTGSLSNSQISLQQSLLPYPQYTGVTQAYGPHADSTYNAVSGEINKRVSTSLTLLANYTFSKALDDARTPLDNYNRRAEKSYSSFHIPQMSHVSFVWALPYGPDRHYGRDNNHIVNALLGNWNLSGIVNMQSGIPFGVGRPAVMSGDAKLSHPTPKKWFNTSVFTTAPAYPSLAACGGVMTYCNYGNVPPYLRDVRSDWMKNTDAVLSRDWKLPMWDEKVTMTFRAEAYNLFNSVQFGQPNNNVTSPSFGEVTSTLNNPRDLQFAAKFRF